MTLQEVMKQQVFVVVGDTLRPEKFAAKIKKQLIENGYTAYGVGKELESMDEVPEAIDVVDLCIRADRGLALLQAATKPYRAVVIQPGAASPELLAWLEAEHIPYLEDCLLVGMEKYPRT